MHGTLILKAVGLVASAAAVVALVTPATAAENDSRYDALVFSKTAAFRHGSIPAGIAAIEKLGREHGFNVDATEDATKFNDADLSKYEVVIWLSTTGDVLNNEQQGAFERYIAHGGGYAGVHAASDTEYDWPWYGDLVGAYFNGHPAQQTATVDVPRQDNPSTKSLPSHWQRFDEWYNFRANPRENVRVLATLDESSYDAGPAGMGADHPIAWCHAFAGGRAWYTALGHTDASYSEDMFLRHLLGGIEEAAGAAKFHCAPVNGPR